MRAIRIEGMTCRHCFMNVTRVLSGIEGVGRGRVNSNLGPGAFGKALSWKGNRLWPECDTPFSASC